MAKTPGGPPPKQTGTTSKPSAGGSKANPTPVKPAGPGGKSSGKK
jgi:hypothetical protein